MREYHPIEAADSRASRIQPSGAVPGQAPPEETSDSSAVSHSPRVLARIPDLASLDWDDSDEAGSGSQGGRMIGSRLSLRIIAGAMIVLVLVALRPVVWPLVFGSKDAPGTASKDAPDTANKERPPWPAPPAPDAPDTPKWNGRNAGAPGWQPGKALAGPAQGSQLQADDLQDGPADAWGQTAARPRAPSRSSGATTPSSPFPWRTAGRPAPVISSGSAGSANDWSPSWNAQSYPDTDDPSSARPAWAADDGASFANRPYPGGLPFGEADRSGPTGGANRSGLSIGRRSPSDGSAREIEEYAPDRGRTRFRSDGNDRTASRPPAASERRDSGRDNEQSGSWGREPPVDAPRYTPRYGPGNEPPERSAPGRSSKPEAPSARWEREVLPAEEPYPAYTNPRQAAPRYSASSRNPGPAPRSNLRDDPPAFDPGDARLEGYIEKPDVPNSYDRARPSIY